jgi:hypothetical protein
LTQNRKRVLEAARKANIQHLCSSYFYTKHRRVYEHLSLNLVTQLFDSFELQANCYFIIVNLPQTIDVDVDVYRLKLLRFLGIWFRS